MTTRRRNTEGGRKHRHIVKTNDVEEARLQALAKAAGTTVSSLLVTATLNEPTRLDRRIFTNQLIGLRQQLLKWEDLDEVKATNRKLTELLEGVQA